MILIQPLHHSSILLIFQSQSFIGMKKEFIRNRQKVSILREILLSAVYFRWWNSVIISKSKISIATSRRDDIISILYLILFLKEGTLPWFI